MNAPANTLYIIRHGENPANISRDFSYRLVDFPLTPKGVRQAEETAGFFRHRTIHELFSSPLKRARETAEIIAAPLGLPVTLVEDFREINVGSLEGQPPTDENWALHDSIIADWRDGRHHVTFPEGEDFHTLRRRLRAGLVTILQDEGGEPKHGRQIIVVAHGGTLTGLVRGLCLDPDLSQLDARPCRNCSISEFAAWLDGGQPVIRLEAWARCDHMT